MNSMNPPESTQSRHTVGSVSKEKRRPLAKCPDRVGKKHGVQATWRVESAVAADHFAIHRFLLTDFQRPAVAEFQTQLEDPFYEPSTRLIIKDGADIVAHLRMIHREIRFGSTVLPVTYLADVATQPKYRGRGCATALLAEATSRMARESTVLGLLSTNEQPFYAHRGWVVCGRHTYTTASPRSIRSHLQTTAAEHGHLIIPQLGNTTRKPYAIRLWRRVECAALVRLYEQATAGTYGTVVRTKAYWQWLLGRHGHDRIYVAIHGRDKLQLDDELTPIVGYAVTRGGRIVELIGSPGHPEATEQLLVRACGDAMEQDVHSIRLDGHPGHPLHELLANAGGQHICREADHSHVFMARLPKPRHYLKALGKILYQRARAANLSSGCELGLMLEHGRLYLRVHRSDVSLVSGKLGRSYLQCTASQLTQLLLGHVDLAAALRTGRIHASTRIAERTALALFPQLPWWHPSWDFLPASGT